MGSLNPVNKSYWLEKLCESNFHKLMRLAPELSAIDQAAVAHAPGKPSLHLKIIDKAPYTLTVELSHYFDMPSPAFGEPSVKVRVYLDVYSAEVLCESRCASASHTKILTGGVKQVLNHKWSRNYFLEKWLSHCLQTGYRFSFEATLEQVV